MVRQIPFMAFCVQCLADPVNKPKVKIRSVFRCSGNRNGSDFQNFQASGAIEKYYGKTTTDSSIPAGRVQIERSRGCVENRINALDGTSYERRFYLEMSRAMSMECEIPIFCTRRSPGKMVERFML